MVRKSTLIGLLFALSMGISATGSAYADSFEPARYANYYYGTGPVWLYHKSSLPSLSDRVPYIFEARRPASGTGYSNDIYTFYYLENRNYPRRQDVADTLMAGSQIELPSRQFSVGLSCLDQASSGVQRVPGTLDWNKYHYYYLSNEPGHSYDRCMISSSHISR